MLSHSSSQAWLKSLGIHLALLAGVLLLLIFNRSSDEVVSVSLEAISSGVTPVTKNGSKTDYASHSKSALVEPPSKFVSGASSFGVITPKDQYLRELKNYFQNQLIYPAVSLANREKGRVEISFTLHKSGVISDIRIEKLSPFERLNNAAVELISSASPYRAFPVSLTEESMRLAIPIDYGI